MLFKQEFLVLVQIISLNLSTCLTTFKNSLLNYLNLAARIIAIKPDSIKENLKSLKELKKIFMENFIDVKEDINRRSISWRNQVSYLRSKPYSRF
jgi:hypothetical protein